MVANIFISISRPNKAVSTLHISEKVSRPEEGVTIHPAIPVIPIMITIMPNQSEMPASTAAGLSKIK